MGVTLQLHICSWEKTTGQARVEDALQRSAETLEEEEARNLP
jgi:hypothetical protein